MAHGPRGRCANAGPRSAERVRLAQEPLTDAERLAFLTIRPEEAAPFERGRAEIARYPCCYRVGPAGWAACLCCYAACSYRESITPCAVGVLAAARESTALARAKLTVKAVSYGGQVEARSTRGTFWQRVRHTIVRRRKWADVSDEERLAYAQSGYCPQLSGKGHVAPWTPTREQPAPHSGRRQGRVHAR